MEEILLIITTDGWEIAGAIASAVGDIQEAQKNAI
jgi:hypothetical protein